MWVSAHVGIAGNERADFKVRQATLGNMVQCTIGCSGLTSKRETENVGQVGEIGKSLKQEGFRTPSFPGSLLDHGVRNGGRR
jgi:hypothetical protein